MDLPLFSILYLGMMPVFAYFGWRLYQNYKKTNNKISQYFSGVGFTSSIAFVIYALGGIFFKDNSFALGLANVLGEPFFKITFVFMTAVFFYIRFPEVSQDKVIKIGLVVVLLTFLSHLYFFPYPYVDKRGVLHFNAHPVAGLTFVAFSAVAYLPLLYTFFREAVTKKHLRKRSLLLAATIIVFFFSGVLQSIVEEPLFYTFSFVLQGIGATLLFLGILSRVEQQERAQNSTNY